MRNYLLVVIALFAIMTTQAQSVSTGVDSLKTINSVFFTGDVDGTGAASNYIYSIKFEYGTDSTGTLTTVDATPDEYTGAAKHVVKGVTGLSAGTTYYYRLIANHFAGGPVTISDKFLSFTTLSAVEPTVASAASVTSIYAGQGVLFTNSVSSNGGSAVTGYGICWSTGTTPIVTDDSVYTAGVPSASFYGTAGSLTAGTKYYTRAYAINAIGVGYGAIKEFVTRCNPPSSTAATLVSGEGFTANWVAPSGGSELDNYFLDISENSDFSTFVPGYSNVNVGTVTSYVVTGLDPTTTYYYQVRAANSGGADGTAGSSTNSSFQIVNTLASEPVTQAVIDSLVAHAVGELTVYFTNGSGTTRTLYARSNNQNDDHPADGVSSYVANQNFGSGSDLGSGSYVVYEGSGAKGSITITNLDGVNDYYFKVVESNGTGADINYNLSGDQVNSADNSNLPVELLNFDLSSVNKTVTLEWSTASELNNDYFMVESSVDGNTFKGIEKIQGAGTSNELLKYKTHDANPEAELMYYRLRQVDFDGKITTLPTKHIIVGTLSSLQIDQAHTLNGEVNIAITKGSEVAILEIMNMNGQIVYKSVLSNSGSQIVKVPSENFSKGIYMIRISNSQQESVEKKIIF